MRRRYKTVVEYENEIEKMRQKAADVKREKNFSHMTIDQVAHLVFQNRWVKTRNNLRLILQFPERENT